MSKNSSFPLSLSIILSIAFIDWLGFGLVYPMFSSMIFHEEYEWMVLGDSDALRGLSLGLLLSMMPLFQFFSAPILGIWSDLYGRRRILLASLAVGLMAYLVAVAGVLIQNMPLLLISRMLMGISSGNSSVITATLADISSSEQKAKRFALLHMAFGLGFTVGPFLGGRLSSWTMGPWSGYVVPFVCTVFLYLINITLVFLFFKETYKPTIGLKRETIWTGIVHLRKAYLIPHLRYVLLGIGIFCAGWCIFWEFSPATWITLYSFGPAQVGEIYAIGSAVYALSCGVLIRPIVNRFPPEKILFYGLLCLGIMTLPLLFYQPFYQIACFVAVQQFLIALLFPVYSAMLSNWAAPSEQGEMMGLVQSVDSFAFAITPFFAGPLLGLHLKFPILIGSGCMICAAYVFRHAIRLSLSHASLKEVVGEAK